MERAVSVRMNFSKSKDPDVFVSSLGLTTAADECLKYVPRAVSYLSEGRKTPSKQNPRQEMPSKGQEKKQQKTSINPKKQPENRGKK